MISENLKIRISRTHIRILILLNYYSCHVAHGSESSLCKGFDVFLCESLYNFLNILLHVFSVLGERSDISSISTPDFYKCAVEYNVNTCPDDLILAKIKDLCCEEILEEDIYDEVRNVFLKTIANEDIIDLFKIKDVMFLYEDILQQLGRNIGNEFLFDFINNIKHHFDNECNFYVDICMELYHEFENTCVQILSNVENWRLERIYILDKMIICIAFIESRLYNTPKAVLINEYIEIAKAFSTAKSGCFVNGILDNIL